jgi:hypothetical protein
MEPLTEIRTLVIVANALANGIDAVLAVVVIVAVALIAATTVTAICSAFATTDTVTAHQQMADLAKEIEKGLTEKES